jgi:hypothetical protein
MPRILSNMAMSHLSSCDHQGGKPSGLARISQHASEPMEPLEAVFFGVSYGPMGSRPPSYQRSMGPKKVLGLWEKCPISLRRSSWRTGQLHSPGIHGEEFKNTHQHATIHNPPSKAPSSTMTFHNCYWNKRAKFQITSWLSTRLCSFSSWELIEKWTQHFLWNELYFLNLFEDPCISTA